MKVTVHEDKTGKLIVDYLSVEEIPIVGDTISLYVLDELKHFLIVRRQFIYGYDPSEKIVSIILFVK